LASRAPRPRPLHHTIDCRVRGRTDSRCQPRPPRSLFPKDLYYRLNVVNLRLPALRTRREDILPLTAHFLERISRQNGKKYTLSDDTLRTMMQHEWPGNVRELENALEHGCAVSTCGVVALGDLPTQLKQEGLAALRALVAPGKAEEPSAKVQVKSIAELERQAILDAIRVLDGDKLKAAKLLGIGKTTLYRKLKEYSISDAVPA